MTFGTTTGAGPEETTKFTGEPFATVVPPVGVWAITRPAETVSLATFAISPIPRLLASIALCAAPWAAPTTLGTITGDQPADTKRLTTNPLLTELPGGGVWLITWPA